MQTVTGLAMHRYNSKMMASALASLGRLITVCVHLSEGVSECVSE